MSKAEKIFEEARSFADKVNDLVKDTRGACTIEEYGHAVVALQLSVIIYPQYYPQLLSETVRIFFSIIIRFQKKEVSAGSLNL